MLQLLTGRSISLGSNPAIPVRNNATATPGLRYKNLGKSGLRVSNVGLGTWPIFSPGVSEEQAEAILRLAIDSGINLFDLSEAHSGIRCFKIYVFNHLRSLCLFQAREQNLNWVKLFKKPGGNEQALLSRPKFTGAPSM